MFDEKSRYRDAETYTVPGPRGRPVTVTAPPPAPLQGLLGYHVRKEGQRLDHLAFHYLGDAASWWRLAEQNDAVLPDALAEADEIAVPTVFRGVSSGTQGGGRGGAG